MSNEKMKQPGGMYLLGTMMAGCNFGYYGMRLTTLLFLVAAVGRGGVGFTDVNASSLLGTFMALAYITPMLGGWAADKILGTRKSIMLGLGMCAVGYFIGFASQSVISVYAMIYLVALGAGFYKGNLLTLLGSIYEKGDPRKDAAFSINYTFINIGVFFGTLICGFIANKWGATLDSDGKILVYGYKYVFLATSMAVTFSLIIFIMLKDRLLGTAGILPSHKEAAVGSQSENDEKIPLTKGERNRVVAICALAIFATFFWVAYYQTATSIVLYAKNSVQLIYNGFEIPLAWMDTYNGFLCIILGPIMAVVWGLKAKTKNGDFNIATKMTLGFLFLAAAFGVMALSITQTIGGGKASIIWLVLFSTLLTVGEMCFSPIAYSMVDKLAPKKIAGAMMGVWFASTFLASKASGYVQFFVDKLGPLQVFLGFTVALVAVGLILFSINKPIERMEKGEEAEAEIQVS
ncbi:peptide MFS transporter [Fusobacteria bacterium ZRK30]|nr:peptide MFS transporter [Fusobacteria bacterium ZRK30]